MTRVVHAVDCREGTGLTCRPARRILVGTVTPSNCCACTDQGVHPIDAAPSSQRGASHAAAPHRCWEMPHRRAAMRQGSLERRVYSALGGAAVLTAFRVEPCSSATCWCVLSLRTPASAVRSFSVRAGTAARTDCSSSRASSTRSGSASAPDELSRSSGVTLRALSPPAGEVIKKTVCSLLAPGCRRGWLESSGRARLRSWCLWAPAVSSALST